MSLCDAYGFSFILELSRMQHHMTGNETPMLEEIRSRLHFPEFCTSAEGFHLTATAKINNWQHIFYN
jgi:hypothetical protein